jgi:putative transposase
MARPLRIQYAHAFYHITGRGNEGRKVFTSKRDYEKFRECLELAKERYGFILHAYVLMGNHYHLLGETSEANLSAVMHSVIGSYTTYFNKKRGRHGHLFQGRYKAILIDHDSYLLELSRYIHLNPVKAGMAERPEDYSYSSYGAYISPGKEDMATRDLIWSMISRDKAGAPLLYRAFVEERLREDGENPFKDLYAGMILGKKAFVKQALSLLKGQILGKDEVSSRKSFFTITSIDEITDKICSILGVPKDQVIDKKGPYRNLALYVTRRSTGFTNRELGGYFGNISYSAVTKACRRFEESLKADVRLRKKTADLEEIISQFKG